MDAPRSRYVNLARLSWLVPASVFGLIALSALGLPIVAYVADLAAPILAAIGVVIGLVAMIGARRILWPAIAGIVLGGLILLIWVPNFLNGMERGRARRTTADLRSLGTAIEEYNIDHEIYPTASSIDELRPFVEVYLRQVRHTDAWGRAFLVDSSAERYAICSGGRDGGDCTLVGGGGLTDSFDDAIVFSQSRFVQWPRFIGQGREE